MIARRCLLAAAAACRPRSMPSAPSPPTRRRIGQWTAFRKYADRRCGDVHSAGRCGAQDFLKDKKDPPKSLSLVAGAELRLVRRPHCGQHRPLAFQSTARRVGNFTTVWQRREEATGAGSMTAAIAARRKADARPSRRSARQSCTRQGARRADHPAAAADPKQARTPEDNGRRRIGRQDTLGWDWKVDKDGSRTASASACGTAAATSRS